MREGDEGSYIQGRYEYICVCVYDVCNVMYSEGNIRYSVYSVKMLMLCCYYYLLLRALPMRVVSTIIIAIIESVFLIW